MSHYLRRFVDGAGQVHGEVPIIGSSASDPLGTGRSLFRQRNEDSGFELRLGSRRFKKETPEPRGVLSVATGMAHG